MLCACGKHRVCCWCSQQLPGFFSPTPKNELPVVGYVLGSCRRFAYAVLRFWQWLARGSCGQRAFSRQVHRCLLLCFERVLRFDQLFLCLGAQFAGCLVCGVPCMLSCLLHARFPAGAELLHCQRFAFALGCVLLFTHSGSPLCQIAACCADM